MPGPTGRDVHAVDAPLTDLSLAVLQDEAGFIARKVFPTVGVAQQSGRYYTYTKSFFNRAESTKRGPGQEAATRDFTLSTDTFACDVYAIAQNISEQDAADTDSGIDLEASAAQANVYDLLIREENLFETAAFSSSVWTTDSTPGTTWDDAASTPIEDIETGKEKIENDTGIKPNVLAMGRNVWTDLRNHPDVLDRVKYGGTPGSPGIVTRAALAQVFDVENVYVARAVENSAAEGLTESEAFVLGKHALLCYSNPNPGLRSPSAGYTFVWTGLTGQREGFRTKRYDVPLTDAYPRIETDTAVDFKAASADLGYFFASCVA